MAHAPLGSMTSPFVSYRFLVRVMSIAIASVLLPLSSYADSGFYVGVGAGSAAIEFGHPDADNFDISASEIDLDGDETAIKIIGGYRFTLLAAELAYIDFGEVQSSLGSLDLSGFSAMGMVLMGIGPVDLFAKSGFFKWDAKADFNNISLNFVNNSPTLDIEATSVDDDGIDFAYGVGAMVSLFGLSGRVEYEYFNVGDRQDLSMVSFGATYTF